MKSGNSEVLLFLKSNISSRYKFFNGSVSVVLDFNDIESLDALRNLDIVFLSLKWNQITDIKPLAGLKEHLWIKVSSRASELSGEKSSIRFP